MIENFKEFFNKIEKYDSKCDNFLGGLKYLYSLNNNNCIVSYDYQKIIKPYDIEYVFVDYKGRYYIDIEIDKDFDIGTDFKINVSNIDVFLNVDGRYISLNDLILIPICCNRNKLIIRFVLSDNIPDDFILTYKAWICPIKLRKNISQIDDIKINNIQYKNGYINIIK